MRLFGLTISRAKTEEKALSSVDNRGGWFRILESFTGAWQRGVVVDYNGIQANHAVFACQTLIASDIAKLRVKLVEQDAGGIWSETTNSAYSPVLRKPNTYQNRIQFWESWILSKLQHGNTYVLKQRDGRGVVIRLYVLDPNRVRPLVADDGSVFYQLQTDNLSGLTGPVIVPAREIIHDRWNCLFHPLCGISPIYAAGLAATHGLRIQEAATKFFENNAMPGGILVAPGTVSPDTIAQMKEQWEANYGGQNRGKVAVLGNGLKYETITTNSKDAQLVEQLKWSAEIVCSVYHVPPYKIGIGQMPTYSNIQALNVEYYSQCLQVLIEAAELCLDEGLEMGPGIGTEFDLDGLLRMDSVTQLDVLEKAKSVMTLDERRRRLELPKLKVGGATVYLQQQDHSIEAIAARDRQLIEQGENPQQPPSALPPPKPDAEPEPSQRAAANINTRYVKALFARKVA